MITENSQLDEFINEQLQLNFDLIIRDEFSEITKNLLIEKIIFLLVNDFEKLRNILYRIDVNEKKVKELFAQNNPKLIAPRIVDLIIERLKEKAESRLKYKNTV